MLQAHEYKEKGSESGVLVALWQDNIIMKFATTIYKGNE
jgi:hypothetical protein